MKVNDINKYHQKIGLKTKVGIINKFLRNLENNLVNEFNLIKLDYPLVLPSESVFNANPKDRRIICFDSFTKDDLFYISGDLVVWLKNKMVELDLKQGEGILVFNKKINRDQNQYTSVETNYATIEYAVSAHDILNANFFYNLLIKIIKIIKLSFDDIDSELTKNNMFFKENYIKFSDFHSIQKLFLRKRDVIENFVTKYESAFIGGVSELYLDDHSIFNPFAEDGKTTKEWFLLNKVNKTINSILKIYIRPDFETLEKQCLNSKFDITKKAEFLKTNYDKQTINIEINLNNVYACVFKEYSNCESSNTGEDIDVKKIYLNKKIKVM